MTVTLHDIVAGLVWLLAAAVLGVVDLIVHARRVRVATVPQPDGPAAGQAQEGDGIGEQAECVTVPGGFTGKGFPARDVTPVAQAPAHNGAGGGWLSSTQPSQEPESLERLLGPVGRTSEREG